MALKNLSGIPHKFHPELLQFTEICIQRLKLNLVSIILFGSVARGKPTKWSDFDFCVVVKKINERDKIGIMHQFDKNCDIVLRKEQDFAAYLNHLSAVDLNIFNEGKVIWGKDVLSQNQATFNEVIREYHLVHQAGFGRGVWEIGVAS